MCRSLTDTTMMESSHDELSLVAEQEPPATHVPSTDKPKDNRLGRFGNWGGKPHDEDCYYTDALLDTLLGNLPLPHHRPGRKDDNWQAFAKELQQTPPFSDIFKPSALGYQKIRDYVLGKKLKDSEKWDPEGLLRLDTAEFGKKDNDNSPCLC